MGDIIKFKDDANNLSINDFKSNIKGNSNQPLRSAIEEESKNQAILAARQEEKRKIKSRAKIQERIKRFKAVGLVALIGATAGITYGVSQIPEFKQKAFDDSLNTVKTSIAESVDKPVESVKVYNNSTRLSSNSSETEYEVSIDGKTFYFEAINDGVSSKVIRDDIKNPDVLEAISDVSNAKKGNLVEALRAKHTAKKIKEGKMNLSMKEAIQEKEQGFEIGD